MTTYWQLPNNKTYIRIDRNGLNTAIGEAILKSFYPDRFNEMNTPIEERPAFKEVEKSLGKRLIKGIPNNKFHFIKPELEYYNVEGTDEWHPFNKKQSPHRFIPLATEETRGVPHALIRHPVERFKSFINRYTPQLHTYTADFSITECIDNAIIALEKTPDSEIFLYNSKQLIPQSMFLNNNYSNIRFYRYSDHIINIVSDIGLIVQPVKEKSTLLQSVEISKAHEDVIIAKFRADLELYNNVRYPGIIVQA